jgi:uncharacterized FlaG/YvyC family protein
MSENISTRSMDVGLAKADFTQAAQALQGKAEQQAVEAAALAARAEENQRATKAETAPAADSQKSMSQFSLKFQVDQKTNDVTILILDRDSRKVVRTIPPEDMNKMAPGELLQLFA